MGLIPGQETKIPQAMRQRKKNIFLKEEERQSSDHPEFYYGALSQGIKSSRVQNNKDKIQEHGIPEGESL